MSSVDDRTRAAVTVLTFKNIDGARKAWDTPARGYDKCKNGYAYESQGNRYEIESLYRSSGTYGVNWTRSWDAREGKHVIGCSDVSGLFGGSVVRVYACGDGKDANATNAAAHNLTFEAGNSVYAAGSSR